MRKLLLFLFFIVSVNAFATDVQIRFVTGFSIFAVNTQPWNGNDGEVTNDEAVNLIFAAHNVHYCYDQNDNGEISMVFARYEGNNPEAFIADLENNPNVLNAKTCTQDYTYADVMYLVLTDGNNGNPTGFDDNGNIVTTNAQINAIFAAYGVKEMTQMSPGLTFYTIYFESDNNAGIKADLDNLELFMYPAEFASAYILLSTEGIANNKPGIFPNPFATTFEITTQQNIIEYSLCDVSGKTLVNTTEKRTLDQKAAMLNSGIYFLRMQSDTGKNYTQKVIKM